MTRNQLQDIERLVLRLQDSNYTDAERADYFARALAKSSSASLAFEALVVEYCKAADAASVARVSAALTDEEWDPFFALATAEDTARDA